MCPSSPVYHSEVQEFSEPMSETQSLAIPLPASHIHRTASELQLDEDNVVAEYRDQCMFNRLVRGIRYQQRRHYAANSRYGQESSQELQQRTRTGNRPPMTSSVFMEESEKSISSIISTRRHHVDTLPDLNLETVTPTASEDNNATRQLLPRRNADRPSLLESSLNSAHARVFSTPTHDANPGNSEADADGGWSIQGFHESPQIHAQQGVLDERQTEEQVNNHTYEEDDQVFEIDL